MVVLSAYGTLKMAIRLGAYLLLGGLVLWIRHRNRHRTKHELDEGTRKMMRATPKDENGKYPWEK
ncbi:hypothetical protein [Lactiplantibacillus modestisalitolerans]|uniref:Uncharacterized protein n=1 Tax=Lactiplantibacillus modestisalitolerans TaxID=1457219 RepID=A0ABV5WT83_9LACO|nr:hypothetical protein [Lactiplantibacillus modestisalitolerans]